jgi:hypothetical protein
VAPTPMENQVIEKESNPAEDTDKDNLVKIVHAVTRVENLPYTGVTQEDVNSLERFIFSEEHLKKNIVKASVQPLSQWEINVQLFVDRTSSLGKSQVLHLEAFGWNKLLG